MVRAHNTRCVRAVRTWLIIIIFFFLFKLRWTFLLSSPSSFDQCVQKLQTYHITYVLCPISRCQTRLLSIIAVMANNFYLSSSTSAHVHRQNVTGFIGQRRDCGFHLLKSRAPRRISCCYWPNVAGFFFKQIVVKHSTFENDIIEFSCFSSVVPREMAENDFFEGAEKLLEIWFGHQDGKTDNGDLRNIPR